MYRTKSVFFYYAATVPKKDIFAAKKNQAAY